MNTPIQSLVRRSRTWGMAASCVLVLSAPCYALAQTSSSNAGSSPSSPSTQPIPGNSPFTFVKAGTSSDKNSTKHTDNGKNEK